MTNRPRFWQITSQAQQLSQNQLGGGKGYDGERHLVSPWRECQACGCVIDHRKERIVLVIAIFPGFSFCFCARCMVFIHEPDGASFSDRGERANACVFREAMSDKVQLRVKMPRHAHPTFLQFLFSHGDVSSPSPFLQKVRPFYFVHMESLPGLHLSPLAICTIT